MTFFIDNQTVEGSLIANSGLFSTQSILIPRQLTATNNGSVNLLGTDKAVVYVTGTATGYSLVLPDSTTLQLGTYFEIYNENTLAITIKNNSGTTLFTINASSVAKITLQVSGTQNGTWSIWSLETEVASGISNVNVTSTTGFPITSTTDVIVTDMTLTPIAGTYLLIFNSSNSSTNNNALNYVSLYKDAVQIAGSERVTQSVASNFVFQTSTTAVTTFNGVQQLRLYGRVSTGTFTINARTLIALRLGG
jgi:hypothetical protein